MAPKQTDVKPLEDFAMWAMLQPGGQKGDIQGLKEFVHDWITMATQKTAGQLKSNKGIPWEPGSKAVSFDNLERIKIGILCEAVALVLSGKLDNIPEWISVEDDMPDANARVLVYRAAMKDADTGPISIQWGWMAKQKGVSHWMPLPEPPEIEE